MAWMTTRLMGSSAIRMIVSTPLRRIMPTRVEVRVMTLDTVCGRLWDRNSRRVSVSLVKRLISSPWVCVSKKLSGRDCMWSNRSLRIRFMVPVEICIIRRLFT